MKKKIEKSLGLLRSTPLYGTEKDIKLFIDREREYTLVDEAIRSKFNILLIGDRGIGMTSLLNLIKHRFQADSKNLVVYYSGFAMIRSPFEFISTLLLQI
jgi:AAA+ ATPase superfamily predicted ATPase